MKARDKDANNDFVKSVTDKLFPDMKALENFNIEDIIQEFKRRGVTDAEEIAHYLEGVEWWLRGVREGLAFEANWLDSEVRAFEPCPSSLEQIAPLITGKGELSKRGSRNDVEP